MDAEKNVLIFELAEITFSPLENYDAFYTRLFLFVFRYIYLNIGVQKGGVFQNQGNLRNLDTPLYTQRVYKGIHTLSQEGGVNALYFKLIDDIFCIKPIFTLI